PLTAQLQDAVPRWDFLDRAFDWTFQPARPVLVGAVRQALVVDVFALAFLVPAWFLGGGGWELPPNVLLFGAATLLAFTLGTVGFNVLAWWMRAALYRPAGRSWARAALVAAVSALFFNALGLMINLGSRQISPGPGDGPWELVFASVVIAV